MNQIASTVSKDLKRVGRGFGSGRGGHTSSRGQKGQGARKSGGVPLWFEGGQLPITKRMPMIRGKSRLKSLKPAMEVNLGAIQKMKSDKITLETLKLEKVIGPRFNRAKIIATGSITRSVEIEGVAITPAAKKAVEVAGGSVK